MNAGGGTDSRATCSLLRRRRPKEAKGEAPKADLGILSLPPEEHARRACRHYLDGLNLGRAGLLLRLTEQGGDIRPAAASVPRIEAIYRRVAPIVTEDYGRRLYPVAVDLLRQRVVGRGRP